MYLAATASFPLCNIATAIGGPHEINKSIGRIYSILAIRIYIDIDVSRFTIGENQHQIFVGLL